jgi:HSP20 family protein
MRIVKYDPFSGFDAISRHMNTLITDLQKNASVNNQAEFSPRMDISETEQAYFIHAELPGVQKEDIKISISEDKILSISGEKKKSEQVQDENFVRMERFYGTFLRTFTLPEHIQSSSIKADFTNGILEISLPKSELIKPKEITVEIA